MKLTMIRRPQIKKENSLKERTIIMDVLREQEVTTGRLKFLNMNELLLAKDVEISLLEFLQLLLLWPKFLRLLPLRPNPYKLIFFDHVLEQVKKRHGRIIRGWLIKPVGPS